MKPSDVFAQARARLDGFLDELIDYDLFRDFSQDANELYKEQFAKKQNPYGEPWDYRAGDEKWTKSYYKFGAVTEIERDSFTLAVASPRANRSCVPFEPRGLGAWRPRFDDLVQRRARLLFRSVRP